MKKSCENCIWADQCGRDEHCEDFSPIDETAMNEAAYIEDLEMRESTYSEIIEEYR